MPYIIIYITYHIKEKVEMRDHQWQFLNTHQVGMRYVAY